MKRLCLFNDKGTLIFLSDYNNNYDNYYLEQARFVDRGFKQVYLEVELILNPDITKIQAEYAKQLEQERLLRI